MDLHTLAILQPMGKNVLGCNRELCFAVQFFEGMRPKTAEESAAALAAELKALREDVQSLAGFVAGGGVELLGRDGRGIDMSDSGLASAGYRVRLLLLYHDNLFCISVTAKGIN